MPAKGCRRVIMQDRLREADIMFQLDHPSVLPIKGIHASQETFTIITDVYQMNLTQFMNRRYNNLTQDEIREIF